MSAAQIRARKAAGWRERMARQVARAAALPSPPVEGSLTRMVGLTLEASGCQAAVGDVCDLLNGDGSKVEAEVVGFAGDKLFLMPTGEVHGLAPSARVIPRQRAGSVGVGPGLLGRIIGGTGEPLDGLGPIAAAERVKLLGQSINPLARHPIDTPLDVGVRSINSLLTVGRGQRIGLFAGSGVGKSVLLGMMARYTSADVIVVGLIGERGRASSGPRGAAARWSWLRRRTIRR
jgi:flagellum-specific ATP synthase